MYVFVCCMTYINKKHDSTYVHNMIHFCKYVHDVYMFVVRQITSYSSSQIFYFVAFSSVLSSSRSSNIKKYMSEIVLQFGIEDRRASDV